MPEPIFSIEQERRICELLTEELHHHCRFPMVRPEDAQHAGHYLGMLADLGDGSLAKGIEQIRKNHEWLSSLRESSSRAGSIVFVLILTSVVTGAITALWLGAKHLLRVP